MVISFSNAFGTGNNFQQQPLLPKKRMERTPAGKLLIDSHKQEKKMPWIPFHWASLPAYSFCHFGAKFDLYTFYYICFFATPTQPCPALLYPALPASLQTDLWQSPLVVFLLFRVALMNSNVCVIELLKFQWTAPACLPVCLLFRLDSWEAFKRRFPFESRNIFTFLCILIYGQVQCNLSLQQVQMGWKWSMIGKSTVLTLPTQSSLATLPNSTLGCGVYWVIVPQCRLAYSCYSRMHRNHKIKQIYWRTSSSALV